MRIAMLLLVLDSADGIFEHRGDVEADVDRLAIGLAPPHDVVAALAVGGFAERLPHQRAAAERLLQPVALGFDHRPALADDRHHRLLAARAVAAGEFRLLGGHGGAARQNQRESANHSNDLTSASATAPEPRAGA